MGQLSALFFKNWILYKRSMLGNILEIAVPIFFILFVILVRKLSQPTYYNQQSFISNAAYSQDISISNPLLKNCPANSVIALTPPTASSTLINQLNLLMTSGGLNVQVFNSEADIENAIRSPSYSSSTQICYAIVAVSSVANGAYTYKLRFNISNNIASSDGPSTSLPLTEDAAIDLTTYQATLTKGMAGANNLVTSAILQVESGTKQTFSDTMSPMYQQQYTLDQIYTYLGGSIGIITLLPLLLIYLRQTSSMLKEKETKVRESMSIMGMYTSYYYLTWFVRQFAVYFFIHIICSVIISRTLNYIPFFVPFIVFILFDIVLIVQSFFIQVFMTRAKIGVVVALLFFAVQFIISFISTNSNNPTLGVNLSISIIPHAAFVLAFQTMLYAQSSSITANFKDVFNNYIIGASIISSIFNIIFYLILTWYLDQVIPNQWGAKKHPLFCCFSKNSYQSQKAKEAKLQRVLKAGLEKGIVQPIDEGLRALQQDKKIIEIIGLRKQFNGGDTIAVQDLTLNMYNNQIFALLGHNGAGKTTSISMLTGMIDPSEGSITVLGEADLQKYRAMIGLCPQHDTLYEDLTVEEHLNLYSTFKGLEGQQLKSQVDKLIRDVNLNEKRDEYSKNLSGGQKRRLSVAIAFAGRSKVIILDEPTSGMDTSARRYIWQLLKTYKNDRIIILTTHFMDEADYLGDRIGIMGGGKLMCCGSSIFLKNRFGVGYNITFVKTDSQAPSDALIATVQKYVPNAKILSNVSAELAMQLPLEWVSRFPALFNEVDAKKLELKVVEYGISITTLQEVFLKVGQEMQQQQKWELQQKQLKELVEKALPISNGVYEKPNRLSYFQEVPRQESKLSQFFIHFRATFIKRLRVIRRDFKSFTFELLLPIIIIIFALFLMRISFITDLPAQNINLYTYISQQNPVVVPLGSSTTASIIGSSINTSLISKYGSSISVKFDTTDTTASNFDQNFLFPIKLGQPTLEGGLFFSGAYQFNTLVNTRCPTSPFFLSTLAAESLINAQFGKNVSLTMINYPLPRTYQQLQLNNSISGFFGSFIFSLALAFKFASIISFIVKEREDRSKHQQIVSGMKVSSYWLANFVYDYALYLILVFVAVGLCKGLSITALTTGDAFGATWMLFLFYGLAYIPLTYLFAFLFKDYGNAQAAYYFLTFVIGGMLPILTFLLRILGSASNPIGLGLAWFLGIYPSFAFGEGLINMGSIALYNINENNGQTMTALSLQISLAPIIYLIVQFFLYFFLLFLTESLTNNENFMRFFTSQANITESKFIGESDVQDEANRALKADPSEYEILTKQLRKVYVLDSDKKYKVAVDKLSFGIKKGEVFGLLGVNGAGKTTTFKMLAGQITSTSGDSYFNGLKISQNIEKVREGLGYCPQFDALIDNLTVREQLELFYDLKSLNSQFKYDAITKKIEEMNLNEYENKLSGTLSGGNKRKLSVAMAMIGNPRIVFLDEPSTGMDPKARRFMQKVISRVATQRKQSTIILTTHSMEEAEALSTRLGIMVSGNFQCIGTPQHIKSKYGEGFQIEIKLQNPQRRAVEQVLNLKVPRAPLFVLEKDFENFLKKLEVLPEDFLQFSEDGNGNYIFNALKSAKKVETFLIAEFLQICRISREVLQQLNSKVGGVEVIERMQTFIRLKVRQKSSIGRIFEFFETNKLRLGIQQYTIKQATVEQIFNRFAEKEEEYSQYHG